MGLSALARVARVVGAPAVVKPIACKEGPRGGESPEA
jgi:hypothetical protein